MQGKLAFGLTSDASFDVMISSNKSQDKKCPDNLQELPFIPSM
jgi:hypothetical protein